MGKGYRPVKLNEFRAFLKKIGCSMDRTKGDHEVWSKEGLCRPIVLQIKNKELSPMVVKSNLKTLNISLEEFEQIMSVITLLISQL